MSSLLDHVDSAPPRRIAAAVGLLALIVRLAFWGLITPDRALVSDAAQYDFLARNLAEGRGFVDTFPQLVVHPTAFRPPGYPAVLSVVYWVLWPSPGIGRAVNVVLGTAVAVTLVLLLARHLGRRSAAVGGLVVALYPNFVANDTYVLTEPLSLLLLLGVLACVLDRRWALTGLATGALVLTRPSAQYLVVLLALYLLWKVGWRAALVAVGTAALVVAPWVARNWAELGSPVLVTSNGFNYAALYSPPAVENGAFIDPTRHEWFQDKRLAQFDEVLWDRELRELATDTVRDDPSVVPRVMRRNAAAMFEIRPSYNRKAEEIDGRNLVVRGATYWLLWPLLLAGVAGAVTRRRQPVVLLSAAVAAYFTLASLVFVAPPRLRSPMELMMVICAAALLAPRTPTLLPSRDDVDDREGDPDRAVERETVGPTSD